MSEQLDCEFCERPLSEHSVAGACPPIMIDVQSLTPWETIGLTFLGAVNELVLQAKQTILARVAIRTIGYEGGRVEKMRRSSTYATDHRSAYYKSQE